MGLGARYAESLVTCVRPDLLRNAQAEAETNERVK